MDPTYCDNNALPTPLDTFIFNVLIISLILLKTNPFLMQFWWDLKREKKVRQKAGSNSGKSYQKVCALPSTPLKLLLNKCPFSVLTNPITR